LSAESIEEGVENDKKRRVALGPSGLLGFGSMTPLTLVVITRDAESDLARCLDSVPFATDKVVLDSGSTDGTQTVAERCKARFFVEEWRGFGAQKKRATELANTDWVLSLDADEALSPDAQMELKKLLSGQDLERFDAYAFPRLSYHMGRWIRHGGWYPDWQIRLYHRKRANWSTAKLHEKVQSEKVGKLTEPILHWVFKNLADQVNTNNRYSTLGADELKAKGKRFSLVLMVIKAKVKFLETYIWKRGFLDGLPGFVIAVGAAYSIFLRWAKLWELEQDPELRK